MKLKEWYALRGPRYIRERGAVLLDRYGLTPARAAERTESCVALLCGHGCPPTLPTPGRVVDRHAAFIRHLQDMGAEIAVHSYDHLDLSTYPAEYARKQLEAAAQAFAHHGIEVHGFRCPYLRCNDDLGEVLPKGLFQYSSNKAIWWDVTPEASGEAASSPEPRRDYAAHNTAGFEVLKGFYQPAFAERAVCTPWTVNPLSGIFDGNPVEIPLCVPDDLQIHDGLRLGPEGLGLAWRQMLAQTHQRGEAFVLLFHPELAWRCRQPFADLLREATGLRPRVWMARLRDISAWWREKAGFGADVAETEEGLRISFRCTDRATILARGQQCCHPETAPGLRETDAPQARPGTSEPWHGDYCRLRTTELDVPAEPRPFVGLPPDAPERIVSFLREQGYILDTGPQASRCAVYLGHPALAGLGTLWHPLADGLALVNAIETSAGPLIRYWRWPEGARSAMAITGDLDALTLWDYASRLFV